MHRIAVLRNNGIRHYRKAPALNAFIHIDHRRRAEVERTRHRAAPSPEKELIRQDVARPDVCRHSGSISRRDPSDPAGDAEFIDQCSGLADRPAPIDEDRRGPRMGRFDEACKALEKNVVTFFPAWMPLRLPMLACRMKD